MFGLGSQTTHCFQCSLDLPGSPGELLGSAGKKGVEEMGWAFQSRGSEHGLLLQPLSLQRSCQVTLLTTVMLVTLQQLCKSLGGLRAVELRYVSMLLEGFILFKGIFASLCGSKRFLPVSPTPRLSDYEISLAIRKLLASS